MLERHRLGDAKQFARRDVAHHDLLALWRGLFNPQMAMQQNEERMSFAALVEHAALFRISDRSGVAQNGVEFVGAEGGEDRDICDN